MKGSFEGLPFFAGLHLLSLLEFLVATESDVMFVLMFGCF